MAPVIKALGIALSPLAAGSANQKWCRATGAGLAAECPAVPLHNETDRFIHYATRHSPEDPRLPDKQPMGPFEHGFGISPAFRGPIYNPPSS